MAAAFFERAEIILGGTTLKATGVAQSLDTTRSRRFWFARSAQTLVFPGLKP